MFYNRRDGGAGMFNYPERREWCLDSLPPNKRAISRMHLQLHYLAYHSPAPIRKKWRQAERQFYKRYFGASEKQSVRFANKNTAHSWM